MNIAIIGTHGYGRIYGGYETFVKNLVDRLVNKKSHITIYGIKKKNEKNDSPLDKYITTKWFYTIENKYISHLIYSLQSTIHALFSEYDVVLFLNLANAPLCFLFKFSKKKTVINVDGVEWERPKWSGLGNIYYKLCSFIVKYTADEIISDSLAIKKIYEVNRRTDTKFIPYGAEIYNSANNSSQKQNYYLIVGRMIPDNNILFIVDQFLSTNIDAQLYIIGDSFYNDEYSGKLKMINDDRLKLLGYVNNKEELYNYYFNCKCYIHGHEYGGTNPSLLTALGCGCAVIALDTPFNKEVLISGQYGLFFKKNNTLRELLLNIENKKIDIETYRQNAQNRIKQFYNWETVVDNYYKLFQKVINK